MKWNTLEAERTRDLKEINPVLYEALDVHLLKKYVYDCVMVTNTLKKGATWCPNQRALIWSEAQAETDRDTSEDQVKMRCIAAMADGVEECLNFTYDTPNMNITGVSLNTYF